MAKERLSPSDMSSLVAERGPIHLHVGATMLMEGEAPQLDELLEHVDGRLHLVPRFPAARHPHAASAHEPEMGR